MGKKYLETRKDSLESSILGVWKTAIEEGEARVDGRTKGYKEHRSKLESNRQRREARKLNKEETGLNEKPAEYLELEFRDKTTAEKAYKYINWKLEPGGNQPWSDITQEGNSIQFEDMDDADSLLKELKPKFRFKIPARESAELDEKHDTHVDPKDRDELDKEPDARGGAETAKKMKKAKEPEPGQMAEAQSGDKEAYKKFFNAALKKFKVGSPAELKGDQKKKFYDYIDANWEGDNEKAEGAMSQVREFKIQAMKAALAKVWGMEEGKNPFAEGELPPALKKAIDAKKKDKKEKDEEVGKNGKTDTGKKAAVIDLKPKIKDGT